MRPEQHPAGKSNQYSSKTTDMNLNNFTIKSQEAVERAQQVAMEQQQQAIEAMNQAAQGAKLLSETETNPDNLLGQLFGP